jgi:hypothetical protein
VQLRHLMAIDVAVSPAVDLGDLPLGSRRVITSTGLRKVSADVADRIARGETVAPSQYYFRTHVRLSTSATRLAWMNDLIAVSTGERHRDVVRINVHEVL